MKSILIFLLLFSHSAKAQKIDCLRKIFQVIPQVNKGSALYKDLETVEGPIAVSFSQPFHLELDVYSGYTHQIETHNQRFHSRVIVYRFDADGANLPETITPVGSHGINLRSNHVADLDRQVHEELYNEYASQGPERNLEIENYRVEDKLTTSNTTHFLVASPDESYFTNAVYGNDHLKDISAASHVQIQVSDDPARELNTERHSGKLDRVKGERWGDLGRGLNVLDKSIPENISKTLNLEISRRERFSTVLRQALGWGNHFAKLDKLVFQVNSDVLEIMRGLWGDQAIAQRISTHVHGHEALEWIVTLNRKQMQIAEQVMTAQSVLNQINKGFERLGARAANGANGLRLHFQPTELERPAFLNIINNPLEEKFPENFNSHINSSHSQVTESDLTLDNKQITFLREHLKTKIAQLKTIQK